MKNGMVLPKAMISLTLPLMLDEGEGGKWTLHGNTLTLKYYYNGEVDEVYELKVLELSSSKAVLEIQIKETDEGGAYEYYNKMTYQKQ